MRRIACTEALQILERGWDDGLENTELKTVLYHLSSCPDCASTAAGWSRAEILLRDFSAAAGRLTLPASMATRVHERLARESAPDDMADRKIMEEADLARFLLRLQNDAQLRQRLSASVDRDTMVDLVVVLAAEAGLRFTASTVQVAIGKAQAANDGELSDEQLEAVAGGASQQLMWFQEWVSRLPPRGG